MAGVDFKCKIKSVSQAKSIIRHCDLEERKLHEHSNKNINKDLTKYNLQTTKNYNDACKKVDDRMAYLDSLENQNKRKDRVIMFSLGITIPSQLKDNDVKQCCEKILKILNDNYGADNHIATYVHSDEIHDYIDAETHKARTSLRHMHCIYSCADKDGHLNGKEFSSRKNIKKINNAIHEMMKNDYGIDFMTGKATKSVDTVETLKNKSALLEKEAKLEKAYETKMQLLDKRERALDKREAIVKVREDNINTSENALKAQIDDFNRERTNYTLKVKKIEQEEIRRQEERKREQEQYKTKCNEIDEFFETVKHRYLRSTGTLPKAYTDNVDNWNKMRNDQQFTK